ncbi:small glutamine-rich tetratricopeptide repeat-containing protein alpha isoform X1 [Orussus abietinus]|uniref:small glutamine-rich tetratricopeptide repeat-containing protein alpha isoform X1 n=1 Tax=Orussus abietinus TaxID=222816 RepID=UPI0006252B87|nr:small glutamine-rich tetratricopeptide repeat-containing protein alpha isoform X1 [Orussus abietinus]XP_012277685.1 small glutamine-rich tetratricopeptide repeat-containing protein alpha isoform X1 [Orussus abietinus]
MAVKGLIASIIHFLTRQLEDGDLTADSRESLEVAIQCLESAYEVQASDAAQNINLFDIYKAAIESSQPVFGSEPTPEAHAEAERLKNEGNALMKAERYLEALANYTKAIELDGRNAVYYCNRAAVQHKLGKYDDAIKDSRTALAIDPSYSKAYGRLGIAYASLERYREAKECYQKALEMEPDNEGYKNNIQLAEEKLTQQGVGNMGLGGSGGAVSGMDLRSLLNNSTLMNMAHQMLTDPTMQNLVSNFMSRDVEQGSRMDVLIEVGQQLAQQMQTANPELMESLRRQMGRNADDSQPPPQN